MTLTDILKVCNVINPLAKDNKDQDPLRLEFQVNEAFSKKLPNNQYHTRATRSIHEVKPLCAMLDRAGFDIIVIYSGDGGIQNFMTSYARMLYEKFANEGEPVLEFVKTINDPDFPQRRMPIILPVKRGTVNVYFDLMDGEKDVKMVARNLAAIQQGLKQKNIDTSHLLTRSIRTIALHSSDDSTDINALELGAMYADGALFKWYQLYYSNNGLHPLMNLAGGRSASMRKAAAIIGQFALSNIVGGSFAEKIACPSRATITIDGKEHPSEEYMMSVALTVQPNLYGLKPGYKMPGKKDGLYDPNAMQFYVADNNTKGFQILACIPSIIQGIKPVMFHNDMEPDGVTERNAREFSIRQQGNYEKDGGCTYIIDGSRTCSAHHTIQATLGPKVQFLDIKGSERMMHDILL